LPIIALALGLASIPVTFGIVASGAILGTAVKQSASLVLPAYEKVGNLIRITSTATRFTARLTTFSAGLQIETSTGCHDWPAWGHRKIAAQTPGRRERHVTVTDL
jgi:hypothetical protein